MSHMLCWRRQWYAVPEQETVINNESEYLWK
jgi:hypothetical protein